MQSFIRKARAKYTEGQHPEVAAVYKTPGVYDTYTFLLIYVDRGQVEYIGVGEDPKSYSQMGHFTLAECKNYRKRCSEHLIRWLDVPEVVRKHVEARLA